jgi:hypothetical protein
VGGHGRDHYMSGFGIRGFAGSRFGGAESV